jgi:hypothetical protein
MAIPVKVSNELLEAARETAGKANRSVTKQIEYWAELGRAIEHLVPLPQQVALREQAADPDEARRRAAARPLLNRLAAALVEREDRGPAIARIRDTGQPVYGAVEGRDDRVLQVWPDGREVVGRFVGGRFVPDRRRARA